MTGMEVMLLQAAGSLMGAMGSARSADASANAARYNADLARMEGIAEDARLRRDADKKQGAMRAAIGKSGVTTAGSPLMALAESAEMAELDSQMVLWSAKSQEDIYRRQAKDAKSSKKFAVGSSLLSGASGMMK